MRNPSGMQVRAQPSFASGPGAHGAAKDAEAAADRAADRIGTCTGPAVQDHADATAGHGHPQTAGQPLDAITRRRLETGFGADFASVRIHAGADAARAADRRGAAAFAQGEAITFAAGRYRPHEPAGMHLLAHEAAHVLQQRAGLHGAQLKPAAKAKPADYKTTAEAAKALTKRYGVAGIKDGAAAWTVAELNSVYDALGKLPAGDVAALKGVTLARAKTLEDAAKKPRDGEFFTSQKVEGENVTNEAELRLADSAFTTPAKLEETVTHEAAHAIAGKARRDAFHGQLKATAVFNRAVESKNQTGAALTSTADDMNPVVGKSNAIANEYNDLAKQRAAAKTKADKADIDSRLKDLARRHAETEKRLGPLKTAHTKAETADKAASTGRDAAEKAKDAAKTAADDTLAPSGQTRRVQKFVDFVTAKGIDPITKYAKDNWPANPEEFYADAYSLFLTDPAALKAKSSDLLDWFKAGKYK
jgi:hypothetical protein